MDKHETLQNIYESYSRYEEELRHRIAGLNIELEHCIRMKEAYDCMIKMKSCFKGGYIDTDVVSREIETVYPKIERTGDEDEY